MLTVVAVCVACCTPVCIASACGTDAARVFSCLCDVFAANDVISYAFTGPTAAAIDDLLDLDAVTGEVTIALVPGGIVTAILYAQRCVQYAM